MAVIPGSEMVHWDSARAIGQPSSDELIYVTIMVRARTSPARSASGTTRLSREEFAVLRGADPAELRKVEQFARRNGLAVIQSDAARRSVEVSGPLSKMSAAFGVKFANYSAAGVTYRGYEGKIGVPDELAGIVVAVLGLDDRPAAEPRSVQPQ
jgi:kumamolisin